MFEKRKDTNQEGPKAHFDAGLSDLTASKTAQASGRAAVIGPRIRVNGDITGDENLVIEGKVEGHVKLEEHRVDVGPSGIVHADIEAKVVKVDGEVRGDIRGHEKVTISRSGNVQGNIVAPRMTLEDGAKFKGSIDMDPGVAADKDRDAAHADAGAARANAPAKPLARPDTKADAKPSSNGQAHIPAKGSKEPGLELKGE